MHLLSVLLSGDHKQKFYWGHKEILLPVYKSMADATKRHPTVDVLISFASLRSAFDSTMEAMQYPQVGNQSWHPAGTSVRLQWSVHVIN